MANTDELYKMAADAVKRRKFANAIGYFEQILEEDPDYVDARKGLRAIARTSSEGNRYTKMLAGSMQMAKIQICKVKKDAKGGLAACEKYLQKDPDNAWVLDQEVQFAMDLDLRKSAAFLYEALVELKPEDADLAVDAAKYIAQVSLDTGAKEFMDKAEAIMAKICNRFPDDVNLRSDQSAIHAMSTMKSYNEATTSRELIKDTKEAKELEDAQREIQTDEDLDKAIERARARVETDKANARHIEILADLLARRKLYRDSIDAYNRAIELDANNEHTKARLGDVKILLVKSQLERIGERLGTTTGDERVLLEEKLKTGRKKLLDLTMGEYARRLRVNPNDLPARYDLGVMLYEQGDFDKAIQQFQKAAPDPRMAFNASRYLGLCFRAKKLYDMAISTFQDAGKKPLASAAERLDVQYEIGLCHLETGKRKEALEVFKRILEKDYGYRDVAQRVAAIQEIEKG